MQYYYGQQMPLRILDECEFWKTQEEEHITVILELVKGLEERYVKLLKEWKPALTETHQEVVGFIETAVRAQYQISPGLYQRIIALVDFCLRQSERFIALCRDLMENSEPVKDSHTAQVVMNHIIVESEYFIGIARTILQNPI